jgi:SAM-dependent methyltransferase
VVRPVKGADCIDFGCGTGRGGHALAALYGLNVTLVDFASNCLDADVREALDEFPDKLRFAQHDLTKPLDIKSRYGFCTDVMEHIPPDQVDTVLENILTAAKSVFFQIACVEDKLGGLVGHPLHLTVENHDWWKAKLEEHGCFIRWSKDCTSHALFYVSRFATPADFLPHLRVNTPTEERKANVLANMALGLPECVPHETQNIEVMILAGGPSLADFEADIREKRAEGMPLITVNGAYNWALDRGLKPSATIIADPREFNKRFVEPHVEGCKYLLGSVCHPEVVKAAPADQTYLWHPGPNNDVAEVLKDLPGEHFPVNGGSTVMLRALPLLRMLGFQKFHIYGWDSCLRDDEHHAYSQDENTENDLTEITVGGRTFKCRLWMAAQAQEFIIIKKLIADEVEMAVYGDGLIAEIIKAHAEDNVNGR